MRGWTAKDLAARCAAIGVPEITTAVIANIETGRRDKDGARRRDVTVDELLTLAYALEMPPVLLFLPVSGDEALQVTPELDMDAMTAVAWVTGDEADMARIFDGQEVPASDEDRKRWARRRRETRPIELLRNIWLWIDLLNRADRPEITESINAYFDEYTKAAARLAFALMDLGIATPNLPPQVLEAMNTPETLEAPGNPATQDPDHLPRLKDLDALRRKLRDSPRPSNEEA